MSNRLCPGSVYLCHFDIYVVQHSISISNSAIFFFLNHTKVTLLTFDKAKGGLYFVL